MPIAEINDHRIYFEDSGGDGAAVVFSHGFTLDRTMWDAQIETLSRTYRCIRWDARGHGLSDCKGPFTFWDSAADLFALLDHLEIESAALVGLSQGAFLSLRAALLAPARVNALVLIASAAGAMTAEERAGYQQMADAWCEHGPVGELADTMAAIQFGTTGFDASGWVGRWQSKPPSAWRDTWHAVVNRDAISDRLGEIHAPALLVHGTADAAIPLAEAEAASAALPKSVGVTPVAGAHCVALTHPAEVSAAIVAFLAGHLPLDLKAPQRAP